MAKRLIKLVERRKVTRVDYDNSVMGTENLDTVWVDIDAPMYTDLGDGTIYCAMPSSYDGKRYDRVEE
jgi:hypothetical protein